MMKRCTAPDHRRTLPPLPLAAGRAPSLAQARKDAMVLGMTLEPPGLDPTTAPPRRSARSSTTTCSKA